MALPSGQMRIIILVGVASLTVACAAHNHVVPAPATSANTGIVTATSAAATPVATGAVTPAGVSSSTDQAETVNQTLVKRGYRVRQINGQLRYCRSETLTGTHFSNTVCLSDAEIKALEQKTRGELDTINRAGRVACANNGGCN